MFNKINKIFSVFFCIILLASTTRTKNLVIVSDFKGTAENIVNSDPIPQPMVGALISVLHQKNTPILVSGHVLKNFLINRWIGERLVEEVKTNPPISQLPEIIDFVRDNYDQYSLGKYSEQAKTEITKRLKNWFESFRDLILNNEAKAFNPAGTLLASANINLITNFIFAYLTPINDRWQWYSINDTGYYLGIPQHLANEFNVNTLIPIQSTEGSFEKDKMIITHLKTPQNEKSFIENVLNPIFKTKKIEQSDKEKEDEWYIFLIGHGMGSPYKEFNTIADFSPEYFQKLLLFFNYKINTKLLFYDTCYSGGEHLIRSYIQSDKKVSVPLELNYTVISTNMFFIRSVGKAGLVYHLERSIFSKPGYGMSEVGLLFDQFFDEIKLYLNRGQGNLINILELVASPFPREYMVILPAIRFAHTQWFTTDHFVKEVFRLTRIQMLVAQTEKKEIIIPASAKYLFFDFPYTKYNGEYGINVQASLKVTSPWMPIILTNLPGNGTVYIKKLDASRSPFSLVLKNFLSEPTQNHRKFYIKDFECINDTEGKVLKNKKIKSLLIEWSPGTEFDKIEKIYIQVTDNNNKFYAGSITSEVSLEEPLSWLDQKIEKIFSNLKPTKNPHPIPQGYTSSEAFEQILHAQKEKIKKGIKQTIERPLPGKANSLIDSLQKLEQALKKLAIQIS